MLIQNFRKKLHGEMGYNQMTRNPIAMEVRICNPNEIGWTGVVRGGIILIENWYFSTITLKLILTFLIMKFLKGLHSCIFVYPPTYPMLQGLSEMTHLRCYHETPMDARRISKQRLRYATSGSFPVRKVVTLNIIFRS